MLHIYEHTPDELQEVLAFRNDIFNNISRSHWEAMGCTAVTARDEGRLVGFIPLQFREQCLNDGVSIPVVYENAVGVAEGLRGRGIGTQMLDTAARFIADRADALMVIRGGEDSTGYRFYRKTGHSDLMYTRTYSAPAAGLARDGEGCACLDPASWVAIESELLALYARRYGRYGGGWRREPGYWQTILESHVYRDRPWWLVTLRSGGDPGDRLLGYMVAVWSGLWSPARSLYIYEAVGEDDTAVERLVRYAAGLGAGPGEPPGERVVVPAVSLANPLGALLERMGFAGEESDAHIMARLLRPDRIWARLAGGSDLLDSLALVVATPHRTLVVNDPREPCYTVRVETKESMLARLFTCRLDLAAALDMELVRWDVRDAGLRRELCRVFEFSEWVQWFTDYV
jgi:GNAT superfamily N-acetyltransferase